MAELKKVMYVEDEPDIRTIAQLALEVVGGFSVQLCCNGHDAMDKAAAFDPDLILLDVMMPGMDGPSTLTALRTLAGFEKKPVVFMTAKAQPSEVADFLALGAVAVIPKPFDPMTLATQIKAIWDKTLS